MTLRRLGLNIIYPALILYVYIAISLQLNIVFLLYVPILFLIGIINFNLGLSGLLLMMPFIGYFESPLILPAYTFSIVSIYIYNAVAGRIKVKNHKYHHYLLLLGSLLVFSTVITGYYNHFYALFLFLLYVTLSFIISQKASSSTDDLYSIVNSIIISGIIAAASALRDIKQIGVQVRRLTIGEDSVRQLANVVAIGLVLTFFFYVFNYVKNNSDINGSYFKNILYKIRWLIVALLFGTLLATVSRGVIISVVIFIFAFIVLRLLLRIKTKRYRKSLNTIGYISIISIILFFLINNVAFLDIASEFFNLNIKVLENRFSEENLSGGSSVRQEIWMAGIRGLDGFKPIYGHGMLSFMDLAKSNGYDFYSHSVFVDVFVSTGLLGILTLASIYFKMTYRSVKKRSLLIMTLLLFVSLNYSTHGDMLTTGFWVYIGLIYGMTYNNEYIRSFM